MSVLTFGRKSKEQRKKPDGDFKFPGTRAAMDGNTAVIMCERESSDAAGAYPITPSTQMGEYWAEATAAGHINVSGRPLIFIEPEGEHAAAAGAYMGLAVDAAGTERHRFTLLAVEQYLDAGDVTQLRFLSVRRDQQRRP